MKRFDIDSFIVKAKTLDLVDLIIFTNDEIARTSLYLKCLNESSSEWIRTKGYLCFIQNTLDYFQTGGNIQITEPALRSRLQPVIEALSRKHQLATS